MAAATAPSIFSISASANGDAFAAATHSASSSLFFTPRITESTGSVQEYWCARYAVLTPSSYVHKQSVTGIYRNKFLELD